MRASASPPSPSSPACASLLVVTAVMLATAGCPKEVAGGRPSDVKVRRVNEQVDPLTEAQQKTADEMRAIAAARRVEAMRLAFIKENEQACERDDECALAQEHCCNCAFKGRLAGINRTSVPSLAQRRTAVCQDYQCPAQVSDDPSCNAKRAVCRQGKCVPDVPAAAPDAPAGQGGVGVEPIPDEPPPENKPAP